MKKFIYSFAVIAALGMVACGGSKTEATEEAPETEVTEVVEEATCCNDTTACCNDTTACCEAAEAAEAAAAVVE